MTEQQRAEYMAIVAAYASCNDAWAASTETIAGYAMDLWVSANERAEKAANQ